MYQVLAFETLNQKIKLDFIIADDITNEQISDT